MIPFSWGEFSSISIFSPGPKLGLVVALSTFGGFGGSLTLGGMTVGGIRTPRGFTMPFVGCWTIPLGSVTDSFSFPVLMGTLAILGVAFCATA